MKTIRFESQEHENFFYSMLKEPETRTVIIRRFSTAWGFPIPPEETWSGFLTLRRGISGQRACMKDGRQAVPSV